MRTWVHAEIVTAALLNTHVRDNFNVTFPALATAAGDTVYATGANALTRLPPGSPFASLTMTSGGTATQWTRFYQDIVTAETTVTNSSSQTTVLTYTVPGSTLQSNNVLSVRYWGSYLDNVGGGGASMRFKYGGTTIATYTFSKSTGAAREALSGIFYLKGDGASNAQEGAVFCHTLATGVGGQNTARTLEGTAAIDSTADQALLMTVELNASNANLNYIQKMSVITFYPNL